MRTLVAAFLCLGTASLLHAQTPVDTFTAGTGLASSGFFPGPSVDSGKVGILLPESLSGQAIKRIRACLRVPVEGAIDPSVWATSAAFAWGLWYGTPESPSVSLDSIVHVDLRPYPDLIGGGWFEASVEWPVPEGFTCWLVGYWQEDADFIRLSANTAIPGVPVLVGYRDGQIDAWQAPASVSGLMVEVEYGEPSSGSPSGILDDWYSGNRVGGAPIAARFSQSQLIISFPTEGGDYELQVVNILGQTVVTNSGVSSDMELRLPWSASYPSGVYFCRIRQGRSSYTVPLVNLK